MEKKRSITRTNLVCWIATILLISGCFMVFFIYEKYRDFEGVRQIIEECHDAYGRKTLRQNLDNVVGFLAHEFTAPPDSEKPSEERRRQVLEKLRAVGFGFGDDGGIFVIDQDGNMLMHPLGADKGTDALRQLRDVAGNSPYESLLRSVESGGAGDVIYSVANPSGHGTEKMILMGKVLAPLGWIVGTEMNLGNFGRTVVQNQRTLEVDLVLEVIYICLLALVITGVALWGSYSVSRSIRREIGLLLAFFEAYPSSEATLDETSFLYREFSFIAGSTAAMVDKIQSLIAEIKSLATKAEANNQSKGTFIASVNYGIRSPISGIMGMAQILGETRLDETQKRYVDSILSSGRSIVEIVDDLESFSSIEDGVMQVTAHPFDLGRTCEEIRNAMTPLAKAKGIRFGLELNPATPLYLKGDNARIRQVLNHLIRNAVTFTTEGSVDVRVRCVAREDEDVIIEFCIQDTGIGISREELGNIFRFNERNFLPSSHKFSIVSLGLAVCKHVVDLMNGEIRAESEKGRGSVFSFTIPLAIARSEDVPLPSMADTGSWILPRSTDGNAANAPRKTRVLLAEDDPVNRDVVVIFLKKANCEVVAVENGREAVEKFKSEPFDMIFMDCEMPDLDGYAATVEIRKIEGGGKRVPIIAITAHSLEKDRKRGIESGMDDYLSKPLSSDTLRRTIKKYKKVAKSQEN
jgi:signal transduction histidine kinase/ActR/RegA family two-component response regulator